MSSADTNDRKLMGFLREQGGGSVGDLVEVMQVTATAVRLRLNRLMEQGYLERRLDREEDDSEAVSGRGRPSYRYHLTDRGLELSGTNYMDLARVMWKEIRAIEDPQIRNGLVERLAKHLAERYRNELTTSNDSGVNDSGLVVEKQSLAEKMREVIHLMGERDVSLDMEEHEGLPVLNVLSCPYPNLAQQDSAICELETLMLSELLGEKVELDACRREGGNCCSFQAAGTVSVSSVSANSASVSTASANTASVNTENDTKSLDTKSLETTEVASN